MIKTFGAVLALGGALVIIYGIFGLMGSLDTNSNSWAFLVLGAILYVGGTFLLRSPNSKSQPQEDSTNI